MEIKWKQKKPINTYSKKDKLHNKLASIYGIEDTQKFMNPTREELHCPTLLKNIEKARDRIVHAINNSEKIAIFSDP